MKRIHFSVGPTVQIRSVHRLRRPFHSWPVPPLWAVSLLCVTLIFAATASAQIAPASPFVVSGEAAKRIHEISDSAMQVRGGGVQVFPVFDAD